MDPHTLSALPAPKTPQENARRLDLDRAARGSQVTGNRRGDDPDRVRPAGNPVFGRKGGDSR